MSVEFTLLTPAALCCLVWTALDGKWIAVLIAVGVVVLDFRVKVKK